jgi:putative transposase
MNLKPLVPGNIYHIYNHANGDRNLFYTEKNYTSFLEKYNYYISPIAETFAFCLMPNHYHFLIRVQKVDNIIKSANIIDEIEKLKNAKRVVSNSFKNFFVSYTNSYNLIYDRFGNLFRQKFGRKVITSKNYFVNSIHYINYNPVFHCFVKQPDDWKYSSYNVFFQDKPTKIKKDAVLKTFGGIENFEYFHKNNNFDKYILDMELTY